MSFGGGGVGAQTPTVHAIRVSDSQYGVVIPVVIGRARVPVHLLWLGDFLVTKNKGPGKGLSGASGGSFYTYSSSEIAAVALGPIASIGRRYSTNVGGLHRVSPEVIRQNWSIFLGSLGQAPWSYLTSNHPGQDIGYSGIAYLATANRQLGTTATLPQETFEVFGGFPYNEQIKDANPRDAIVDMITNAIYGMAPQAAPNWAAVGANTIDGTVTWINLGEPGVWTTGAKSAGVVVLDDAGNVQEVTIAGTSGSSEPNWNLSANGTTHDGSVVWTNRGLPTQWVQGKKYPVNFVVNDGTGNIQRVIVAGVASAPGWVDSTGTFATLEKYCIASSFFISQSFDQQRPGREWLKLILELLHVDGVWSEGQFRVVPYCDAPISGNGITFTPDLTPVMSFTSDDFLVNGPGEPPLQIKIADPTLRNNVQKVEYVNVLNDYNIEPIEYMDESDVVLLGARRANPRQYHPIPNSAMARAVAQLKAQWELYVTRQYSFRVAGARGALLDPMDIVAITDDFAGLTNYPIRLISVNETESSTNGSGLDIELVGEDLGPNATPGYPNSQPPGGTSAPNTNAIPPDVNTPVFMELPFFDPTNPYQIWVGLSGQFGNDDWGGANVWLSIDGGNTYAKIDTAKNPSQMGTLLSSLPSGTDPDNANTLSIDLSESDGVLTAISNAQADNLENLAYVDGELIAFAGVAAGASPFQYNLTYLRRGCYGTTVTTHPAGANFVYLGSVQYPDDGVAQTTYPPDQVGSQLWFKFTSFNVQEGNEQDLSDVTAYSYTPNGPQINVEATNAVAWAPNTAYAVGDTVTNGAYSYLCLVAGTSGSTTPKFKRVFGATNSEGAGRPTWQNIGRTLQIERGSITGITLASLAQPVVLGSANRWAASTSYALDTVVLDSHGNGEQVADGADTDSVGNMLPGTWTGHYSQGGGGTTPSAPATISSAHNWSAVTVAVRPATGGATPQPQGVTNFNVSGTVISATLPVPSGVKAGDLLLVQIVKTTTVGNVVPGGWTPLFTQTGTSIQSAIYFRIADGTEAPSYTWSWTGAANASASMIDISGSDPANPIDNATGQSGSSVNPTAPPVSSTGANRLIMFFMGWGGSATFTAPPSASGTSEPGWPGTEGSMTQDGMIQWEQVGPFSPYGSWITLATVTMQVQDHRDTVRIVLSGDTAVSNMGVGDKAQVRFMNGTTQLAKGRAAIHASSTGSGSSASGESSPVILRKHVTGLSGTVVIQAQVQALNGSGNGQFALAIDTADLTVEDQIK